MTRARFVVGLTIVVTAAWVPAACSGGDGDDPAATATTSVTSATGISEAEAVELAQEAWLDEEPGYSFDDTRAHVAEIGDTYDVSWVPVDNDGPGGEPHVVIDRVSGEVLDVYRTK